MDIPAATLALYAIGAAALVSSLGRIRTRLELSKAKHPSFSGHSRMARRVARLIPFYELASDNIEGITFGPMVDGKATLILVSDNNFSGTQFTQFVALQVNPVPEPETWALMLIGLALTGGLARRQSAGRA